MNVMAQTYRGYGAADGIATAIGGSIAMLLLLAAIPVVLFLVAAIKCLRHREDAWQATGQQQVVWILVILLMPCLGPILYLSMAQTRITAWRRSLMPPPAVPPIMTVPAASGPGIASASPDDFPPSETPTAATRAPDMTVVVRPLAESEEPGFCHQCGTRLRSGNQFCISCGAQAET